MIDDDDDELSEDNEAEAEKARQQAALKRPRGGAKKTKAPFNDNAAGYFVGGINGNTGAGFTIPSYSLGSRQGFGLHPSWFKNQKTFEKNKPAINYQLDKVIKKAVEGNFQKIEILRGIVNKQGDPFATDLLQKRIKALTGVYETLSKPDRNRVRDLAALAGISKEEVRERLMAMEVTPGKSEKELLAERRAAATAPPAASQPAKPPAP